MLLCVSVWGAGGGRALRQGNQTGQGQVEPCQDLATAVGGLHLRTPCNDLAPNLKWMMRPQLKDRDSRHQDKYIIKILENADATPPHLDVFMRLGSSADLLGSLQFPCKGGAQLMHENTLPNRVEHSVKDGLRTTFAWL